MHYLAALAGIGWFLVIGISSCSQPKTITSSQTEVISVLQGDCRSTFDHAWGKDTTKNCEVVERHIEYLEFRMEDLCKTAGEQIGRTVKDVEGIYMNYPDSYRNGRSPYFHEDDRYFFRYIGGDGYDFFENDPGKNGTIIHWYVERDLEKRKLLQKQPNKVLNSPEALYEVTWKALTDDATQRYGLYGDELTIKDRRTSEILGSRRIYFYVISGNMTDRTGNALSIPSSPTGDPYRLVTCWKYHAGYSQHYTDKRPRDSSEFVKKVLRPRGGFKLSNR